MAIRQGEAAREPIFNMPTSVAVAIALLILLHAIRQVLQPAIDFATILDFGFVPAPWTVAAGWASASDVVNGASVGSGANADDLGQALANLVITAGPHPWTVLTYAALHATWTHVLLNCVWLAAFATPVVRRCGTARGLALTLASAVAGAAGHWLLHPDGVTPLIGASAIVSGFMAAAATFVFEGRAIAPAYQPLSGRLIGSFERLLRNRTAVAFLLAWFVMNLLTGIMGEPLGISGATIAWEAHLGGFIVGLLLFPFLDPNRPKVSPGSPQL